MPLRICSKCGEEIKDRVCKPCLRLYHREWYQKNKARRNAQIAAWQSAHPEKRRQYSKITEVRHKAKRREKNRSWRSKHLTYSAEYEAKNFARRKDQRLRHTHGITLEHYYFMLQKQFGGCGICAAEPKGAFLYVDHDHKTGVIRGLLCDLCNRGLGFFRDSSTFLEQAKRYLTEQI